MDIGLTGGIACGKSTVSAMFIERGAILIDADRIAREVVMPGTPTLARIAEQFGQAVLAEDGTLNRKKLGNMIFGDTASRKQLESIIHPAIRAVMKQRMKEAKHDVPGELIVVDVPLLFESGLQSMFSEVVVVYVPEQVQLQRLMIRDELTEQQARERLQSQMPIEEKRQQADYVIDNSGSIGLTEQQVDTFLRRKGLR